MNSSPEKLYNQQGETDDKVHVNAGNPQKDFIPEIIIMDANGDWAAANQQQSATPTSVIVLSVLAGTLVALLAVIVGIAYVRRRKATVSEKVLLLDNWAYNL